jgi:hypothetical protein
MKQAPLRPLLLAVACSLFLTGFARVEDRVQVHGDGSATLHRRAEFQDWAGWSRLTGETQRKADAREARHAKTICEVAKRIGWSDCKVTDNVVELEHGFDKDSSPFSGSGSGRAYLAIDRYLAHPLSRPMLQPALLGLQSSDAPKARALLQGMGYRHQLEVTMPGEIDLLLGREVSGVGRSVRFDLMAAEPPPGVDFEKDGANFIESPAGLLHSRWFPGLVLGVLALAGIALIRRLRNG